MKFDKFSACLVQYGAEGLWGHSILPGLLDFQMKSLNPSVEKCGGGHSRWLAGGQL